MSLSINNGLTVKCLICASKASGKEDHNVKTQDKVDRTQAKD